MKIYKDGEFQEIISDILENSEFQKLDNIKHHGITRLNHSLRVSYHTYLITKLLHLNYIDSTKAALLHDFFTDEVKSKSVYRRLTEHPKFAAKNAKKYFDLTAMQEDIIKSHMFPVSLSVPKYLESWIVDIVDDIAAIYEKAYCIRKEMNAATTFLFILILNYIKTI